jgi:hypothetical protein
MLCRPRVHQATWAELAMAHIGRFALGNPICVAKDFCTRIYYFSFRVAAFRIAALI